MSVILPNPGPPGVGVDEKVAQIWDTIVSILASEMNVGPNGPGTGTNIAGRLQTVLEVRQSADIGPNYPCIGVQQQRCTFSVSGTSRQAFEATFHVIIAAVASVAEATGLVTVDAAMTQLRQITADGQGNGVGPILRDQANFQLNGLAQRTLLSSWEYAWEDPRATDAQPRVFAVGTFQVWGELARR
jgi:hypothetical protein